MRFVIVNELPYLYVEGRTYQCRWDAAGFTVGAEVEMTSVPGKTYSELSVLAQYEGYPDSITASGSKLITQEPQKNIKKPTGRKKKTDTEQEGV